MALTKRLTSSSNPLLKEIRKAAARGVPTADGYYIAETFHLLGEALRSHCQVGTVVAAEAALARVEVALQGQRVQQLIAVPDDLFPALAATESPQGVLVLVRPPEWKIDDLLRPGALVVALDGMQDPGNAGTVIRAAEAFGASGVFFLRGSVNPFNPKAMRASAGSVFRVPTVVGIEPGTFEAAATAAGATIFAAYPSGGVPASEADFRRPCAILVGAEGPGLDPERWAHATTVSISTRGVESLNAAVSAAILLYEANRQRGETR